MAIRCGIVGLPNVGNRLSSTPSPAADRAENYPFCTIDPNIGVCPCPIRVCKRSPHRPAGKDRADQRRIRGLAASSPRVEGRGLGNKFLSHIREVDAVAHVVRCFENDDIIHVAGRIDPRAHRVINTELALADLDSVERRIRRRQRRPRRGQGCAQYRDVLERVREQLNKARPVRALKLDRKRGACCATCICSRETVMYVATSRERFQNNPRSIACARSLRRRRGGRTVCAAIEAEISQLDEAIVRISSRN